MTSENPNFQTYVSVMKHGESSQDSLIRGDCTSTRSNSNSVSPSEVILLRKQLKFFFMNPVEKWNVRRRFPYKFFLQLCNFAENRYKHMNYSFNNQVSFSHLFLNNWDASREVISYPPEAGPLAIYKREELYRNINYAVNNYHSLSDAVGPYTHVKHKDEIEPLDLCIEHFYLDHNVIFSEDVEKNCLNITWNESRNFSVQNFLKKHNVSINFNYLARITLHFELYATTYKYPGKHCIKFQIRIVYDNSKLDGQILLSLKSKLFRVGCRNDLQFANYNRSEILWENSINYCVILICTLSMILCIRAIYKAQLLKYKTVNFFKTVKKVELSVEGRLSFYNFWYILIITNDFLIIIGSYMQGQISKNEYLAEAWSICSLSLGTGNMLVWFGVLRYFEFFKTYNVVMLTLKCAFPKIMRFLLCSLIIYAGYVFCGWLVLGPFHIKFRQLSTTSECLFSLINGDDMFATFIILEADSKILWWYCRIYIYSFISLFIYVILSLLLSVIIDAYETIKDYYKNGFPKNDLQNFIYDDLNEDDDELLIIFPMESNHGIWCLVKDVFSQWKGKRNENNETPNRDGVNE